MKPFPMAMARPGAINAITVALATFALIPARARAQVNTCTYLTQAEVEGIVGKKVLPGSFERAANVGICTWGDPASPKVGGRPLATILSVSIFDFPHAAAAKDVLETARRNAGAVQPVSGVGDEAFWDETGRSTLWIIKGRYQIEIEADSDDGLAVEKKVAAKVLTAIGDAGRGRDEMKWK